MFLCLESFFKQTFCMFGYCLFVFRKFTENRTIILLVKSLIGNAIFVHVVVSGDGYLNKFMIKSAMS